MSITDNEIVSELQNNSGRGLTATRGIFGEHTGLAQASITDIEIVSELGKCHVCTDIEVVMYSPKCRGPLPSSYRANTRTPGIVVGGMPCTWLIVVPNLPECTDIEAVPKHDTYTLYFRDGYVYRHSGCILVSVPN